MNIEKIARAFSCTMKKLLPRIFKKKKEKDSLITIYCPNGRAMQIRKWN